MRDENDPREADRFAMTNDPDDAYRLAVIASRNNGGGSRGRRGNREALTAEELQEWAEQFSRPRSWHASGTSRCASSASPKKPLAWPSGALSELRSHSSDCDSASELAARTRASDEHPTGRRTSTSTLPRGRSSSETLLRAA